MEKTIAQLTTVAPEEGKTLGIAGGNYRVIITGQQTGGAYAVIEMWVPPGGGPQPHAHAGFQESFYVLEGEVEVKTKGGAFLAKKGAFVNIPMGGMVHCFKNKSTAVAKLLCTVVPAGLEEFFIAAGQPEGLGEFLPPPPMDDTAKKQLQDLATQYGQVLYPPNFLD